MAADVRSVVARAREALGPVGAGVATGTAVSAATWRAQLARIQALGYRGAWPNEGIGGGRNAFAQLGVMLAATDTLVVGTGIANIWARHPATMQAGASTIADAYPGRLVLGVGVSHAPLVEPVTGQPFGRPIAKMRTYLEQMDAEAGDQPATFPRLVAALGPRMLEVARDHADGAVPAAMPVAHTARARQVLGKDKLLVVGVGAYLDADDDIDRARSVARSSTLFKLPGSPYLANYLRLGYTDADLTDGPSDRIVDAVFALGGPKEIAARVREHLDAGADHVMVQIMAGDVEATVDGLERLAPECFH